MDNLIPSKKSVDENDEKNTSNNSESLEHEVGNNSKEPIQEETSPVQNSDPQGFTGSLVSYDYSSSEDEEKGKEDVNTIVEPEVIIKEEPEDNSEILMEEVEEILVASNNESIEEIIEEAEPCKDSDIIMIGKYRKKSYSDSDTEEDSSSESDESSDSSEIFVSSSDSEELDNRNKEKEVVPSVSKPVKKKKNPNDEIDLPPIEDLKISVEERETKCIGFIYQIVDSQVVVQAYQNLPAINLDSVLFLDKGKRTLGRVFDVFGQIHEPLYVVRFNSAEHVKENGIEKETLVYFAPETEHTSYVIMSDLLNEKGSDASWKDDKEPPPKYLDFSDDEEERKAKQARKNAKKMETNNSKAAENPFSTNFSQCDKKSSMPRYGNFSNKDRRETFTPEPRRFLKGSRNMSQPSFGDPPRFRCNFFPQLPPKRECDNSYEYYVTTPPPPSPSSSRSPSPFCFQTSHFGSNLNHGSTLPPHPPPSASPVFPSSSFPLHHRDSPITFPVPSNSPINHNTRTPPPHFPQTSGIHSRPVIGEDSIRTNSRYELSNGPPNSFQNFPPRIPNACNDREPLPPTMNFRYPPPFNNSKTDHPPPSDHSNSVPLNHPRPALPSHNYNHPIPQPQKFTVPPPPPLQHSSPSNQTPPPFSHYNNYSSQLQQPFSAFSHQPTPPPPPPHATYNTPPSQPPFVHHPPQNIPDCSIPPPGLNNQSKYY